MAWNTNQSGKSEPEGLGADRVHVTDDVIIPQELIEAHRDGNLVIFVGAGASMAAPSSLPSFRDLAKELAKMACVPFRAESGFDENGATQSTEPQEIDRFLGRMPKNFDLQRHALDLVSPDGSIPNSTHEAIISLAASSPALRVVTTNYDDHLAKAADEAGIKIPNRWDAPILPQGDDFEGLVHLHGSIQSDQHGVVLTDKDFGKAYLADGWATRFLVPMFRKYVVLFIGYSYGDLIMRYLTRGLSAGVRCFILIDGTKASADDWTNLGVTPIRYPVVEGNHEALVDALRAWDELARMRGTDHRDRMTKIVTAGKNSLTPVDHDYLVRQLTTVQGVDNFAASCRLLTDPCGKNSWLRWIEDEIPEFSKAFKGESVDDVTKKILHWYADTFIADPCLHGAALQTVSRCGQYFNDDLLNYACRAVLDLERQDRIAAERWKIILSTSVRRAAHISLRELFLFGQDPTVEHLAVLREFMKPRLDLYPYSSYSEDDLGFPHCEPNWDAGESSLSGRLQKIVEQVESRNIELESALESSLLSIYQLVDSYHDRMIYQSFDEFDQVADTSNEQYIPRTPVNSLVDALRDYGVKFRDSNEDLVQRWWAFGYSLFQRLAVHLVTESNRSADEKINWVLDHDALYVYVLRPEVLRLLMESISQASCLVKDRLLTVVVRGSYYRDEILGDRGDKVVDYGRYEILSLLYQEDPSWSEAGEIIRSLKCKYSNWKPVGYQDVIQYTRVGIDGGKEPIRLKDFLKRLNLDANAIVGSLLDRQYSPDENSESSWLDACCLVSRASEKRADAGVAIIQGMKEYTGKRQDRVRDFRRAVVEGWAKTDLLSCEDSVMQVVDDLSESSDERDLTAVGSFLVGQAKTVAADSPFLFSMKRLAKKMWSHHVDDFKHQEGVPLSGVAPLYLHCWPGMIILFWIEEIAKKQKKRDDCCGLDADEKFALRECLHSSRHVLDATLPVLAMHLTLLFSVDEQFVCEDLLPLFDDQELTELTWGAYLYNCYWTNDLLNSGLLQSMSKFWPLLGELEDSSAQERFMMLTCKVLTSAKIRDGEREDLLNQTVLANEGAFASRFALTVMKYTVMKYLVQDEVDGVDVWHAWLGGHIGKRLKGLPREPCEEELKYWADIVPFLGSAMPEAIKLMSGYRIPLNVHHFMSPDFPKNGLEEYGECLVAFYSERILALDATKTSFFPTRRFGKFIQRLQCYLGDERIRPLIEAAREVGV